LFNFQQKINYYIIVYDMGVTPVGVYVRVENHPNSLVVASLCQTLIFELFFFAGPFQCEIYIYPW